MAESRTSPAAGDRLAKVIARSGLCSRRDAESWIVAGRVAVNGKIIRTPAFNVTDRDKVEVDKAPLADREGTRVWLYHKPAGLMVTEKDPEGRPTVFEAVAQHGLPRVVSIGRLDFNTEGLLLLTNDGGLKRVLELPATGWLRKYRVRAFGSITQAQLDALKTGVTVDGVKYGPIDATLESERGANVWLEVSLREGKNREVKNVLASLGLEVNRLIRISYGPFQLNDIPVGAIETVKARVLREQLGKRLAEEAEVDFDSDLPERGPVKPLEGKPLRERETGRGTNTVAIAQQRFRFIDRAEGEREEREAKPRRDRPGRFDTPFRPAPKRVEEPDEAETRKVHFDVTEGRESLDFQQKTYGKAKRDDKPGGKGPGAARGPRSDTDRPRKPFGERPARDGADRPKRDFGDRPKPAFGAKKTFADRPKKDFGDRPRPARTGNDARRSTGPRPAYAGKPRAGGDRARPARTTDGPARTARPYSDRPARPGVDRPKRDFADKPRAPRAARPDGDRPRAARASDGPVRSERPARTFGDKPRAARPASDRPRSSRPTGAAPDRKPYVRKEGTAPERKPYARKDGGSPERKPYPRKDGAAPARKPYVRKEGAPARSGPRTSTGPARSGPRKDGPSKPPRKPRTRT